MSGNICRCGAYPNILAAILETMARPDMIELRLCPCRRCRRGVREKQDHPSAKIIARLVRAPPRSRAKAIIMIIPLDPIGPEQDLNYFLDDNDFTTHKIDSWPPAGRAGLCRSTWAN